MTYERSTLVNDEKYIGLDVHQATISVAVVDASGKVVIESILETKAATILEFFARLRGTLSSIWSASSAVVGQDRGSRGRAERLYEQLNMLQHLRQQARRALLAEGRKHAITARLLQIPYLGPIRSVLAVAPLQTPHRFRTERQLWPLRLHKPSIATIAVLCPMVRMCFLESTLTPLRRCGRQVEKGSVGETLYMTATESLELEHRKLARVADACEILADELLQGSKIPANILESLADFLRLYAEQYHRQEEKWLFGMLRQKGVPAETWLVAGLSRENDKLKVLVDQLGNAVDAYSSADVLMTGSLADILRSLAELYQDHIWKEDYLLLPMADKILSDADQQVLTETFHAIEGNFGAEAHRSIARLSAAIKTCPLCSSDRERVA